MLGNVIKGLVTLIKLPIKLILLPFKAVSFITSVIFYLMVLALLGGLVYLFVL